MSLIETAYSRLRNAQGNLQAETIDTKAFEKAVNNLRDGTLKKARENTLKGTELGGEAHADRKRLCDALDAIMPR